VSEKSPFGHVQKEQDEIEITLHMPWLILKNRSQEQRYKIEIHYGSLDLVTTFSTMALRKIALTSKKSVLMKLLMKL
jgi:fluoride ion exporter CrcB/FEX